MGTPTQLMMEQEKFRVEVREHVGSATKPSGWPLTDAQWTLDHTGLHSLGKATALALDVLISVARCGGGFDIATQAPPHDGSMNVVEWCIENDEGHLITVEIVEESPA